MKRSSVTSPGHPARRAVAVLGIAALGLTLLTGCKDEVADDDAGTAGAIGTATEQPAADGRTPEPTDGAPDASGDAGTDDPDDGGGAQDDEGQDPEAPEPGTPDPTAIPDGVPAGFPDIGVPFYHPSEVVAAPDHGGDPYVLELVTDHELSIVNMFIRDHFSAEHGWQDVTSSVQDQMTITQGNAAGYSLVIAVGPERTDDTKTSLHYTLRPE